MKTYLFSACFELIVKRFDSNYCSAIETFVFSSKAQSMVQNWAQGQVPVQRPVAQMVSYLPAPVALPLLMLLMETPQPTPPQSVKPQTATQRVGQVS